MTSYVGGRRRIAPALIVGGNANMGPPRTNGQAACGEAGRWTDPAPAGSGDHCFPRAPATALGEGEHVVAEANEPVAHGRADRERGEVIAPAEVFAKVIGAAFDSFLGRTLMVQQVDEKHVLGEMASLAPGAPGAGDDALARGEEQGEEEAQSDGGCH